MKILYVEDNPANLSLLQRIARMGGHIVVSYTDGESALTQFESDKPDLVLMDVQLAGGITGLDVVRMLRARGYKTPIIAVTAYAMTGDRDRCIEAGCDTYIAKPLPVAELVELVQRYEARLNAPPVIQPLPSTSTPTVETKIAPVAANSEVEVQAVVTPFIEPVLEKETAAKPEAHEETKAERLTAPMIKPMTPPDSPASPAAPLR